MSFARGARVSVSLAFFFALPLWASAATLTVGSVSTTVGGSISVPITVSASSGESLNAISANLSFPTDKLTLLSVSKSPSIITLWAQEPAFSNTNGTAALEGIVPNPGYSGSGGRVVTLLFSAKSAGSATISFSSASVLANDGRGTEILRSSNAGTVTITAAAAAPTTPAPEESAPAPTSSESSASPAEESSAKGLPATAFVIESETHPDQLSWYKAKSGTFTWSVPQGATATRLLLSSSPTAEPTILYERPIGSKVLDDIPDGTSYLAVQHSVGGEWGGVGRYRINIDTNPPRAFRIAFPHGTSGYNPQPIVLFNTLDGESGIDRYEIKVGTGDLLQTAPKADSNPYTLPPQEPGTHTIVVTAYDKVGNATTENATFEIEGIETPRIMYYDEAVQAGDIIKVRGTTYENADVYVHVYDRDGKLAAEEFTRSNSLGDFSTVISRRLFPGTYSFTARVVDGRGARSLESEPLTFTVEGRFFVELSNLLTNYLGALLLTLLIIGGLIGAGVYGVFQLRHLNRQFGKQGAESLITISKSFTILRRDIEAHIRALGRAKAKRDLTEEEISFLETFEDELTDAETAIKQSIKKKRTVRKPKSSETAEE